MPVERIDRMGYDRSDAAGAPIFAVAPPSAALLLLLGGGLLLAVNVNLFKAGMLAGLAAPQLAFAAAAGAGAMLLALSCARSEAVPLDRRHLEAYAALGLVSFAIPAVVGPLVASRIGAGFASVQIALTPILTLALAVALRIEGMRAKRVFGLALGLVGTLALIAPGISLSAGGDLAFMLIGLAVPAANATGNILRGALVPRTTPSRVVVTGVLLAAALLLAPLALSFPTDALFSAAGAAVLVASAFVTALFNATLFRLQRVAGPVTLSQIGYVAAAFGVALAALLFGEVPPLTMVLAIALIVAGVRLV